VRVWDLGRRRSGIVTFTKDGVDTPEAQRRLAEQKMNVSVSDPPSTRLDAERRQLPSLVRASVHYFNTEDELDRFAFAVDQL
jgi:cysteine desulfurase / selenocysteine lyase